MAQSAPGSHQENNTTAGKESGTVSALISYLRRIRVDMFSQVDKAQHCRFCGQHGRCDCQTKRGDDSAIEEDKSDITEAPGDEAMSALCQVQDTMRQILQEITEIKESAHSKSRRVNDVVTHDKYQHVVDDLLAARSRYQELEDKLCRYENALKSMEEEEEKKKLESQSTIIHADASEQRGANAQKQELTLQQENSLKSESGHHVPDTKHTDIDQVKEMMSKLLQEISDIKKDKTVQKDTVAEERILNDTVVDAVMEALDVDEIHVKSYDEGTRTSTPSKTKQAKDEDDKMLLEMQTSPIRKNPMESSSEVFGSHPRSEDRKVKLMTDSQVQTVPIPRSREEVLKDLVRSDTQDGVPVSTSGQERTMPMLNKTDSWSCMSSQECETKGEKHGLQHLENKYVPDTVGVTTSCEKEGEKHVNSSQGSCQNGKDAGKAEDKNVEGKVFSTSFFGFGQKAQDEGSASLINQLSSGFGKLSKLKSWVGDSIASTAMQITGRNGEKTAESLDQQQNQNVSEHCASETVSTDKHSGNNPLSSEYLPSHGRTVQQGPPYPQVSQTPVSEPPFTATYVTVQSVSPRGTLFHLLQKPDKTAKSDSISSTGNLKSETSQVRCQKEKAGQEFQVPQTTFTEPMPQETLQMADPVRHSRSVQRKGMRRSASLPRQAHLASSVPRSVHGHVHNVGVVTSTSQEQLQRLPRKGILHQKQHVCDVPFQNSELWRRRGSNCVHVDTQEIISSDAAASDDSKMSYSTKRQKHVTYSPYVQRKIISPRHSPKDRPKFVIPFLVEYDDSTSTSEEDLQTMYIKSSASAQGKGYDQRSHRASQKPRSSEMTAGQKKLSSNSSDSPQASSGLSKKTSSNSTDEVRSLLPLDHRQASSNFLQVPGTVPSVRPKVRLRLSDEDSSTGRRHSREKASMQQSGRQSRTKYVLPSRQAVSSENDPRVYRVQIQPQVEIKSRERESVHHPKNRAQVSMPDEVDFVSSHPLESAAIGKSRKDQTLGVDKSAETRSPHLQQSMGSNIKDGMDDVAPGTKDIERLRRRNSMRRSRRDKTVASATGDKDMYLNSHLKHSRYQHRSRSLDRDKTGKTADRTSRNEDSEERLWQQHGSHSPRITKRDGTSETVRVKSRPLQWQQDMPNAASRRSRREDNTAEMGKFLFWSQVAAKSPQLKPRIIHSPQQIYGNPAHMTFSKVLATFYNNHSHMKK